MIIKDRPVMKPFEFKWFKPFESLQPGDVFIIDLDPGPHQYCIKLEPYASTVNAVNLNSGVAMVIHPTETLVEPRPSAKLIFS